MIQIDMPMPTNCLTCPACNEYLTCAIPVNGRKWGENDVSEFGFGKVRPEWCPLKEQENGKWIDHTFAHGDDIECPFCHKKWNVIDNCTETFDYCPGCGAKLS